jgi:hypothetical protein
MCSVRFSLRKRQVPKRYPNKKSQCCLKLAEIQINLGTNLDWNEKSP